MDSLRSSSTARPSAWEWIQVVLLVGNLSWTILCLGGVHPSTAGVTFSLTSLLLGVNLLERALTREPARLQRLHPAGWLLLPFLAYAAANAHWVSPAPWLAWRDWLGWVQIAVIFWVVLNGIRSSTGRSVVVFTVLAVCCIGVVMACYQFFVNAEWMMLGRIKNIYLRGRASGSFGLPNSFAGSLLLVTPLAVGLAVRSRATAVQRVFAGYVALVLVFGLALTVSRGAWLALAIVGVVYPLAASKRSASRRFIVAGVIAGAAAITIGILYHEVPLAQQRLSQLREDSGEKTRPIIWRGAWNLFQDHVAVGAGGGSFNDLFERYRPEGFRDQPRWAHNEYLHLLCEYGVIGFLLLFGAAAYISWRSIGRRKPLEKSDWFDEPAVNLGIAAGLMTLGLHLCLEFHLKVPGVALLAATLSGIWVQRNWSLSAELSRSRGRFERLLVAFVASMVMLVTWRAVLPRYKAEALQFDAREAIDGLAKREPDADEWSRVLGSAQAFLEEATKLHPQNAAAWSDLSYARSLSSHLVPQSHDLGARAESAARQALEQSEAVAEFWVRLGVALDLQGRHSEATHAFAKAVNLAPNRAAIRFYQAFHFSLLPDAFHEALTALEVSLRLDPWNPQAQALRQRLADRSRAR